MKCRLFFAAAMAFALSSGQAFAGVYSDDLGKCLVASSSPKDQVVLMRWLFSAFSANPNLKPMVASTAEQREGYNKDAAVLLQRLLLEDCRKEAVAALKNEGASALESSFAILGQVAARGVMSDPAAQAEMGRMATFMDATKMEALAAEAGIGAPAKK